MRCRAKKQTYRHKHTHILTQHCYVTVEQALLHKYSAWTCINVVTLLQWSFNFAKHTISLLLTCFVNNVFSSSLFFLILSFISSSCWPDYYLTTAVSSTGKRTISCTLKQVCYLAWFHPLELIHLSPTWSKHVCPWQVLGHMWCCWCYMQCSQVKIETKIFFITFCCFLSSYWICLSSSA